MEEKYQELYRRLVDEAVYLLEDEDAAVLTVKVDGSVISAVIVVIAKIAAKENNVKLYGWYPSGYNENEAKKRAAYSIGRLCDEFENVPLQMKEGMVVKSFVTTDRTDTLIGRWKNNIDMEYYRPLGDFFKTEVYALAKYMVGVYANAFISDGNEEWKMRSDVLSEALKAEPIEELTVKDTTIPELRNLTYQQVDDILAVIDMNCGEEEKPFKEKHEYEVLSEKYGKDLIDKIVDKFE